MHFLLNKAFIGRGSCLLSGILLLCLNACKKDTNIAVVPNNQSSIQDTLQSNNQPAPLTEVSSFIVMKVDFLTYRLEGFREYSLTKKALIRDSIPLKIIYTPPTDFGRLSLSFAPTGDSLFYGSIVWMGAGGMKFPAGLDTSFNLAVPKLCHQCNDLSRFQKLLLPDFSQHNIPFKADSLYLAISRVNSFNDYYKADKKVLFFLFTPDVGNINPLKADWIVYMFK